MQPPLQSTRQPGPRRRKRHASTVDAADSSRSQAEFPRIHPLPERQWNSAASLRRWLGCPGRRGGRSRWDAESDASGSGSGTELGTGPGTELGPGMVSGTGLNGDGTRLCVRRSLVVTAERAVYHDRRRRRRLRRALPADFTFIPEGGGGRFSSPSGRPLRCGGKLQQSAAPSRPSPKKRPPRVVSRPASHLSRPGSRAAALSSSLEAETLGRVHGRMAEGDRNSVKAGEPEEHERKEFR